MSFFDEADEPVAEPRTAPRQRRPSGTGGRPPSDAQAIRTRRIIAIVGLLVVIVVLGLLVHSCQVSQVNTSMKDFASNVSSLNQQSTGTASDVFHVLSSGGGSANASSMQSSLIDDAAKALNQLNSASGLDTPDQMQTAHTNFVRALQMRHDAIVGIANKIEEALGKTTNQDAINQIAQYNARFYASDVLYKNYTTPEIAQALQNAGITLGFQLDASQSLPSLDWLQPSIVAHQLGTTLTSSSSSTSGTQCTGVCGHSLDSVSVGGTTLQPGSTNTIPASPPPQFTLSLTNGGTVNEKNVKCDVSVSNTSIKGSTTIPQTTAGQSTTCTVTLSSSPTPGNYTVTATVEQVPGEKNTQNNTQTFPVTFQ